MTTTIRTPQPIDLTDQRIMVGDTVAFVEKMNTTQEKLENWTGQDWNNFAADVAAVAGELETARDESVTARNQATAAAQTSEAAASESIAARNQSVAAAQASETARDESVAARNQAVPAAEVAVPAAAEAVTARNEAVSAKDLAIAAKTAAEAAAQVAIGASFPAGTRLLFPQTAAPIGWTKITTYNNRALRVVSGVAGAGGNTLFTDAFNSPMNIDVSTTVTVSGRTLTVDQMPSHRHRLRSNTGLIDAVTYRSSGSATSRHSRYGPLEQQQGDQGNAGTYTGMEDIGGGVAHDHAATAASSGSINFNVAYVDVIICEKD